MGIDRDAIWFVHAKQRDTISDFAPNSHETSQRGSYRFEIFRSKIKHKVLRAPFLDLMCTLYDVGGSISVAKFTQILLSCFLAELLHAGEHPRVFNITIYFFAKILP